MRMAVLGDFSMPMVSFWGNMCTMRACRVSMLLTSCVMCTRRVSSPNCRNSTPGRAGGHRERGVRGSSTEGTGFLPGGALGYPKKMGIEEIWTPSFVLVKVEGSEHPQKMGMREIRPLNLTLVKVEGFGAPKKWG